MHIVVKVRQIKTLNLCIVDQDRSKLEICCLLNKNKALKIFGPKT